MTTGYVALYTIGGDGLGIASAATDVSLANRNLALGTGSLTATNLTGTLQTAAQANVTSLGTLTSLNIATTAQSVYPIIITRNYPAISTFPTSSYTAGCALTVSYVNDQATCLFNTGRLATKSFMVLQTLDAADSYSSVLEIMANGDAYHPGTLFVETITQPTLNTKMTLFSSTQNRSRLTFSGQEFYQAANTSQDGPAFALCVNRTNNRQLLLVDSANASIATTTNYALRFIIGSASATIDAISTDCVTGKMLTLGNSGSGVYFPGNLGVGVIVSSTVGVHLANALSTATPNQDLYGLINQRTYTYNSGATTAYATGAYFSCQTVVNSGASLNFAQTMVIAAPTKTGVGTITHSKGLQVTTPTVGTSSNIATYTDNLVVGGTYINTTPPASGAIIEGNLTLYSGVLLPTSGGTATLLNYYEELTYSMTFTGIWAANQTVSARIVRNGKLVVIMFPSVLATANAAASITTAAGSELPARFRPFQNINMYTRVLSGGASGAGYFVVTTAGAIDVSASLTGAAFASSGNGGFVQTVISYHVF